jgi:hypothetical protein
MSGGFALVEGGRLHLCKAYSHLTFIETGKTNSLAFAHLTCEYEPGMAEGFPTTVNSASGISVPISLMYR